MNCTHGTFTSSKRSVVCTECSAGKYQPSYGAVGCDYCLVSTGVRDIILTTTPHNSLPTSHFPLPTSRSSHRNLHAHSLQNGTYSVQGGATMCEPCPEGSFARSEGSTTCAKCKVTIGIMYTSSEGSTSCNQCERQYYMKNGNCKLKPDGVNDEVEMSTLENLILNEGWYRFSATSEIVYECLSPPNCVGGAITNTSTLDYSSLCRKGSGGPFCWRCDPEFYLNEDLGCINCTMTNAWLGLTIIAVLSIAIITVAFALKDRIIAFQKRHKKRFVECEFFVLPPVESI